MEDTNKKKNIMTLVAVITLVVLVAGATYAYFSVGITNNFGTSTINATAEGMGSVALNGTNASLLMDLSAADMMKGNAGTYFASSTGTTRDATEVLVGTATLVPTTDTRKYECTYTLNITHSSKTNGADDIYDVFSDTTKYANKSKDQIYLSVNGKDYDWYNGFPSTVTGKIYVTGGVPADIKVGMRLINSTSIDQSALAGHDIQINVAVPNNGFSCEIVDNTFTNKIPENGVYIRFENGTPTKAYYTNVSNDVKTQVNNKYSINVENIKDGEEFPSSVLENDEYIYGDYYYDYNPSYYLGWHAHVLDDTKTRYEELLSEINGIPLTSLYGTFEGCTSLTSAPVIPNTVTEMAQTFMGCTSLTSVPAIPNSVTDMGYTFIDCTSLVVPPTIGTSVTYMGSTFEGCTSLTSAPIIPNSVTYMDSTFWNCTSLVEAPTIPNSVTDMNSTFRGCTSLAGEPIVNANPSDYLNAFFETQITGIGGTTNLKAELYATK